jgi:endoglucanase
MLKKNLLLLAFLFVTIMFIGGLLIVTQERRVPSSPGDGSASASTTPSITSTSTSTPVGVPPATGTTTPPANLPVSTVPSSNNQSGAIRVTIGKISSDAISITWSGAQNASGYKIYLAPSPDLLTLDAGRKLVASVSGNTTSYIIKDLAASVDVFIRVEVTGSKSFGNAHAQTLGGPRASLSTPLREVHLMAPDMLMMVLENKGVDYNNNKGVLGNLGASWQGGSWKVTRNEGSSIAVTSTYRHSIPVDLPVYNVGVGASQNQNILDVDHRIYLKLAAPVGEHEILNVAHAGAAGTALNFTLPFSDKYLATPVVQVNQVGYNPISTKRWAYVSGWLGDGGALSLGNFPATAEVIKESNNVLDLRSVVVSAITMTLRKKDDVDAGASVDQIDLSKVPVAEGVFYHVRIPGVGVSWPTQVSNLSVLKTFYTTARGLFLNRWGRDLQCQYTDWCTRPPDNPVVYFDNSVPYSTAVSDAIPATTPKIDPRSISGGHHDAGDFDQNQTHTAIAQFLLRAYELNPSRFPDGQLNIPESGNGIPDLLDEALWEIKAWEQLQDADGGVHSGVSSFRHPNGIFFADQNTDPQWTFAKDPDISEKVAALFANASRLVAPFDAARAAKLKTEAIKAYEYGVAHNGSLAARAWALGALFRLTGDQQYKTSFDTIFTANFLKDWTKNGPSAGDDIVGMISRQMDGTEYDVGSKVTMGDYWTDYALAPGADPNIAAVIKTLITKKAKEVLSTKALDAGFAHRTSHPANTYDWGHASSLAQNFDSVVFPALQFGTLTDAEYQDIIDSLSLNADSMLGGNPAGEVWTTGLGSRSPQEPLHLDSLSFVKQDGLPPMPGIPIFGPIRGTPGNYYYKNQLAMFYPAFGEQPLMYRFSDTHYFVVTSEFSTAETMAPNTLLFATLLPSDQKVVPDCWKPGKSEHKNTLPVLCGTSAGR